MRISLYELNRAGLSGDVILQYQSSSKCKRYIEDMKQGNLFPPIRLYNNTTTIADAEQEFLKTGDMEAFCKTCQESGIYC